MDLINTTKNGGSQLGAERVPYSVFNFVLTCNYNMTIGIFQEVGEFMMLPSSSTAIRFSPYTESPMAMFFVTRASSFPLAMKTP